MNEETKSEAEQLRFIIRQHMGWMEDINNAVMNFSGRMDSLEEMMVDYMEQNPKTNDKWTEARLRHLEDMVKKIKAQIKQIKEKRKKQ